MDLAALESQIAGSDANSPVSRRELIWALRQVRELFFSSSLRLADVDSTITAASARLAAVEAAGAKAITLTIVANVGALPPSASARQWFRVQGSPSVYVGNGAGQPLTTLTPV